VAQGTSSLARPGSGAGLGLRRGEMTFLTTAPPLITALILLGGGTFLAMLGAFLVRSHVALDTLRSNNEVAGFKFATVGVLYAVLLAFAVVVVWEKFSQAENEVASEAGAAATLYRLWEGTYPADREVLRGATSAYLTAVIDEEWPSMAAGHESPVVTLALNGLYGHLLADRPHDDFGTDLLSEALYQLDQLTQARRARIVMAGGAVPGLVWVVLFGGAVLTIGFTFFFGAENLKAQALMTGALALLVFAVMLVIVAIDRPFSGTVIVEPTALMAVLTDFGGIQR
jgi:hypothetical protein